MKTLKYYYNEMFSQNRNYYNDLNFQNRNLLNETSKFIESYLRRGSKLGPDIEAYYNLFLHDVDTSRLQHVESIYFLGLILYDNVPVLQSSINSFLEAQNAKMIFQRSMETSFEFYWFLICFFHDFGYSIERQPKYMNKAMYSEKLNKYSNPRLSKNVFTANYILGYSTRQKRPALKSFHINDLEQYLPQELYQKIWDYLWYRIQEFQVIDHGIFGGIMFLEDRIKSLYRNLPKSELDYDQKNNDFSYMHDGLYWSSDIVSNIFFPVAATIIGHNIWYSNDYRDSNKYYQYNLNNLIIDRYEYTFGEFPLLHFFQLVDTLDFFKGLNVGNTNHEEILAKVKIDFVNGIRIKLDYIEDNIKLKFIDNIIGMNNWMPVEVSMDNNMIKIIFL